MQETIETLKKEYEFWVAKAKELEMQSKEAFHNAENIQETIGLIKQREKMSTEPQLLFPTIKKTSDKYKGMSMSQAIIDILRNEPELKGSEIFHKLEEHGYESESKNLRRDVYTRLFRITEEGKIIAKTRNGEMKRYSLPEDK
jgi:hypothetical protein